MMELTKELVCAITQDPKVCGSLTIPSGNNTVSLEHPWRRVTIHDVGQEEIPDFDFAALVPNDPESLVKAKEVAGAAGVPGVAGLRTIGKVLNQYLDELCEPKLIQPTLSIILSK